MMNRGSFLRGFALSFVMAMSIALELNAQSIDGAYVWSKEDNVKVLVKGESFLMIKEDTSSERTDTLAVCTISKVRDYLFEINSDLSMPRRGMETKYRTAPVLNNSARINVLLPNYPDTLTAEIHMGISDTYKFDIVDGKGAVEIPFSSDTLTIYLNKRKTKSETIISQPKAYHVNSLLLRPQRLSYSFNRDDLTYSRVIVGFEHPDFELKPQDDITFYAPGITPDVFNRYCVEKEYFRIRNDILYWKGEIFLRQTLE